MRALEMGCGLGLPSIAAALAGADVLATDWSDEAVATAAANAERNGAAVRTALWSWTAPSPGRFDLVLASDVLYERRNVDQLLDALPRLADEAWIADPGRALADEFLERAASAWEIDAIARNVHRLRLRGGNV